MDEAEKLTGWLLQQGLEGADQEEMLWAIARD